MEHHFNTTIAKEVGVIPAILANNIKYWIDKNIANRKHFIDGRYWTYNSITALQELFDYLSPKQIRSAVDKLIEAGYLVKGDFSENRFNRPIWYSLEDKYYEAIGEKRASRVAPEGKSVSPAGQEVLPIGAIDILGTNINSNINTDNKQLVPIDYKAEFEIFRKAYNGKKVGLDTEYANFIKKNKPDKVLLLMSALIKEREYRDLQASKGKFVPNWKELSTWINKKCWEQEFPDEDNADVKLGVGERFENGKRTYGTNGVIVPNDASPRPSEQYIWSKNEGKWKIQ